MESMTSIPNMLLIGSTGRNSGKTTLAVELIKTWKSEVPVVGLKVTTIKERNGKCPRGGEGCGVCSSLNGNFEIVEEKGINKQKDTVKLLEAGAQKVYWIKTLAESISEAIDTFLKQIPKNVIIVCESNSLRNAVKPGCFLMLKNNDISIKESARQVMDKANEIISFGEIGLQNGWNEIILNKLKIVQNENGLEVKYFNLSC